MLAPLADRVADLPTQMVAEPTVTVGLGFTTTFVVAVATQPPEPTVTVYTPLIAVVADGRVGFCWVELKLAGPLQE